MIIYTVLSHTLTYLPYQIKELNKYFPNDRIIVVQDDTAINGAISLTAEQKEILGIKETLSAPPRRIDINYGRAEIIFHWVKRQCPDRYGLVIHGDMFPRDSIDLISLLQDKAIACHVIEVKDRTRVSTNWQVFDTTKLNYEDPLTKTWDNDQVASYGWTRNQKKVEEKIGIETFSCEWYEPIWLHLDKMLSWGNNADVDAKKISILHQLFGVIEPQNIEPQNVKPQNVKPQNIKKQEETVLRLKTKFHMQNITKTIADDNFIAFLPEDKREKILDLRKGCGCNKTKRIKDIMPEYAAYFEAYNNCAPKIALNLHPNS